MPKMTSTPTASSDRTRLCAPVMPVAGSVGAPVVRSAARTAVAGRVVSTPSTAAAASRVADSLVGLVIGGSPGRRGGTCGAADLLGWSVLDHGQANKKPLVPRARRAERVGTGPAR